MGIQLTTEQVMAQYEAENWFHKGEKQVFEISAKAGCGKSTLVRYIIKHLGLKIHDCLYVAFSGKAAARLAKEGLPAKTIHSAIYDYVKEYARDENNKIIYNKNTGKPKKIGKFVLKDRIASANGKSKVKLIVVDEGSMVSEVLAKDLLSFDIPVIVLGDLNQLPPVFGKPFFLQHPDVILTKNMRQAEGNPIVHLCDEILAGHTIGIGTYGTSRVISKSQLNQTILSKASIVLTETNRLRWNINNLFREEIRGYKQLDYPHIGEKVICCKNNWHKCVGNDIYLTNGMSGYVVDVDKSSFNKRSMTMDFRPDFTDKIFTNLQFNYKWMYRTPTTSTINETNPLVIEDGEYDYHLNRFDFGYAITTHKAQGEQYSKVVFLNEKMMHDKDDQKRLEYTAVSRAIDSITIVI